ncbi:hypothetical protein [Chitinimonas lacunae]|uniref:Uncharacterized protein n=1 Tax=Chitinimonas lacunae TaxID=1963018 RepID=A0ABV8MSS0_9NEIS
MKTRLRRVEMLTMVLLPTAALILMTLAWHWRAAGWQALVRLSQPELPRPRLAGLTGPSEATPEDRRAYLTLYARLLSLDPNLRLTVAPQRSLAGVWRASRVELDARVASPEAATSLLTLLRQANPGALTRECQLRRETEAWRLRCAVDFIWRAEVA